MRDRSILLDHLESPISHYPKQKVGRASITKHRYTRGSVFWAEGVGGNLYYEYSKSVEGTALKIGNRTWMTTDYPYIVSLKSFAERSSGKVLVAGLGLGIVVHYLVQNPAVTEIKIIDREPDVIRLVSPLLPNDPRIQIIESDFWDWCDKATLTEYCPDTVIWDLAVSTKDQGVTEGKELPVAKFLIIGRFTHLRWTREGWIERKDYKPPTIFIHGIDRDPVGEEFVKTDEFRKAYDLYMAPVGRILA